ncbi:hypothetical protein PO909_028356 [Leuciscus waleckii]
MEGNYVTLHTGVTIQQYEELLWYFNDILIAQINGESSESCLYDGEDGRFRDRLEVDYETGSLTITNIRFEHAGHYEAENIRIDSSGKRQSLLNRNPKCDSTKITWKISSTLDDTIKTFSVTVSGESFNVINPEVFFYKMNIIIKCFFNIVCLNSDIYNCLFFSPVY